MYNETILNCEVKRVKRSFGEALLAARRQNGMSQQQLADALFVNRSSVAYKAALHLDRAFGLGIAYRSNAAVLARGYAREIIE